MLKRIDLTLLKKILALACVVSFAYAAYPFFNPRQYTGSDWVKEPSSKQQVAKKPSIAEKKDYGLFLEKIKNRQIFAIADAQEVPSKKAGQEELNQIAENLKLVGVMLKEPRKVIIEDRKTGGSLYLKEGESFLGGVKVEKIETDLVSLSYGGETFELHL